MKRSTGNNDVIVIDDDEPEPPKRHKSTLNELLRGVSVQDMGDFQKDAVTRLRSCGFTSDPHLQPLRHQWENVFAICSDVRNGGGGGVLCERPGSGKTLCILIATALDRSIVRFGIDGAELHHLCCVPPIMDFTASLCTLRDVAVESLFAQDARVGLPFDLPRRYHVCRCIGSHRRPSGFYEVSVAVKTSLYLAPQLLLGQVVQELYKFSDKNNINGAPFLKVGLVSSEDHLWAYPLEWYLQHDLVVMSHELLRPITRKMPPTGKMFFLQAHIANACTNQTAEVHPLFRINFRRIFVDEGAFLGSDDGSDRSIVVQRLHRDALYIVSGTAFTQGGLLHMERMLTLLGKRDDAECVKALRLQEKRRGAAEEEEVRDVSGLLSKSFIFHQDHDLSKILQPMLMDPIISEIVVAPTESESIFYSQKAGNVMTNLIITRGQGIDCLLNDPAALEDTLRNLLDYCDGEQLGTCMRLLNLSTIFAELCAPWNMPVEERKPEVMAEFKKLGIQRHALTPDEMHQLRGIAQLLQCPPNDKVEFSKFEWTANFIRAQLDQDPSCKFLVFAFHRANFKAIRTFFEKRFQVLGIGWRSVSDSRKEASNRLNEYRESPHVPVLLANDRVSHGLNLTMTTHIIFVDVASNPAIMTQAIARGHRLGQTKKLQVFHLFVRGTLEMEMAKLSGGAPLSFNLRQQIARRLRANVADEHRAKLEPLQYPDNPFLRAFDPEPEVDILALEPPPEWYRWRVLREGRRRLQQLMDMSIDAIIAFHSFHGEEMKKVSRKGYRGWNAAFPSLLLSEQDIRDYLVRNALVVPLNDANPDTCELSEYGIVVYTLFKASGHAIEVKQEIL